MNTTLHSWFSKIQPTVETLVIEGDFFATKQGMDAVRGIRYKLMMMGVPIYSPISKYDDHPHLSRMSEVLFVTIWYRSQ